GVVGDEGVEVSDVASVATASGGDLVFVEDEKHLHAALNSGAAAVIAGAFAESATTKKHLLIAAYPRLAFARAVSSFPTLSQKTREEPALSEQRESKGWGNLAESEPSGAATQKSNQNPRKSGIHPSAVVLPSAVVAEAVIDPCAHIGEDVRVGER